MRPRTRRRLLMSAMISTGLLLMAEASVSIFGKRTLLHWQAPVSRTQTGAPYLPGSPYLLWEMSPGARTELGAQVEVNTSGLRGPEVTSKKAAGTRRVLIVGDSSVYGHGVDQKEVFSALLNDSLGPTIEVINGGVPGYSTFQTLNLLELRGWNLAPDLLVIANLWSDNNFDSFVDKELISARSAFDSSWAAPAATLLHKSALYRWMDWKIRLAPRAEEVKKVGWMLGRGSAGGHRRVEVNDYAENLHTMVQRAQTHGSKVMFLALANTVDLGVETEGAHAWPLYREVMEDVALQVGAPFVAIQPALEESGVPVSDLFIDEMHPSPAGHAIIATTVETSLSNWINGVGLGPLKTNTTIRTWDDPFARGEAPPTGSGSAALVTVSGSVIGAPAGIPLQIDLIDLDEKGSGNGNPMVGSARFDHVDQFEMPGPRTGRFGIRIYLDKEGDGPSDGDTVYDFSDTPINATGTSITGVIINLQSESVELR
jgi:hypothetical protein